MKAKTLCNFAILAMQAVLLTGCVTAKVWTPHNFAGFHEPANPANVQLFYSSQIQDVLVEYDEKVGNKGATRRRAYWLEQNQAIEGTEKRPHFVSPKEVEGLPSIPVAASIKDAAPSPNIGLFALTTNSFAFQLCGTSENQDDRTLAKTILGEHELPAYYDSAGRRRKIMLTPPAVVADLSIIAGIAALIAAYAYAQSAAH
jgi:hypothetical protein